MKRSTLSVLKSLRRVQRSVSAQRRHFLSTTSSLTTDSAPWSVPSVRPLAASSVTAWSARRSLSTAASFVNPPEEFPSLLIKADSVDAQGEFAEATAKFLEPDNESVQELTKALIETDTGIVAHYYMDVELQGTLTEVAKTVPEKIGIADSLKMGDMAVDMVKAGATQIICLGVDFMAESVKAILTKQGFGHIPVYRADARKIGCSLAESAEQDVYRAWLQKESEGANALHVIYINTSLETKAVSSSLVPTITCTSSNVLQTMLQASAQMQKDGLKVLYGPDTYMGQNLQRLLEMVADKWDDEQIASQLHPAHNKATIKQLRHNLTVFPSGNCVVHHMFGGSVVETVEQNYDDCYVTAHLEVPGEMFEIAMVKSLTDQGVVGSTSNILDFIKRKVQETADTKTDAATTRLRFILGTEAGMVTSIVQSVQNILRSTSGAQNIEAEIIFPVASEAVTATDNESLKLVPGVSGGEGCSTAGGCATCPYMKMNDLDAVMDVLEMIRNEGTQLQKHLPPDRLSGKSINGQDAIELGSEAILFMRGFMNEKQIPADLCKKILKH